MLSRKAKYGLKAALRLAAHPRTPVLVADLAEWEHIPKKFLEQILLELKHRGVLQSRKGKGGGYLLARPATDTSIGEIIRALDGPIAPIPCVSESAYITCDNECDDERTCAIRLVMKEVRDAMTGILDRTTLADAIQNSAAAASLAPEPLTLARSGKTPPRPSRSSARPANRFDRARQGRH